MSRRSTAARIAAHTRWANEPDRAAATAAARSRSPISFEYWLRKKREEYPDATQEQLVSLAESAHRAYQAQMSARARKRRERAA